MLLIMVTPILGMGLESMWRNKSHPLSCHQTTTVRKTIAIKILYFGMLLVTIINIQEKFRGRALRWLLSGATALYMQCRSIEPKIEGNVA